MKVIADHDLCQGHGVCEDTAPEVFRLVASADGGYSLVEILVEEPDEALRRKVEEAVRYCPNRALKLEQR